MRSQHHCHLLSLKKEEMMYFPFSSLVPIWFGPYVHDSLGRELVDRDYRRVLLLTDEGLEKAGHLERVQTLLKKEGIESQVFRDVHPNPDLGSLERALDRALSLKPQALVAIGGGSVLDTAKGVGIWYTNSKERLWDLEDPSKRENPMLPVITVPTTAGTGSEVSSWAVITHNEKREKVSIGGEKMAPALAFVDPSLTLSLPPHLTLWTGLDALTHALEAFLAWRGSFFLKELSLSAIQRIFNYLPRVIEDGQDLEAREEVMLGSLLAGLAMENAGLGLVHGMSHQISAFYNYQHGLTNAILLPYVLDFNADTCREEFAAINRLFTGQGDLVENLRDFYKDLGFSKECRIKEEDLSQLAVQALENVNTQTNPKPVDQETILKIYKRAFLVE